MRRSRGGRLVRLCRRFRPKLLTPSALLLLIGVTGSNDLL